jgi:hypothetical protein
MSVCSSEVFLSITSFLSRIFSCKRNYRQAISLSCGSFARAWPIAATVGAVGEAAYLLLGQREVDLLPQQAINLSA